MAAATASCFKSSLISVWLLLLLTLAAALPSKQTLTRQTGAPVGDNENSLVAGEDGGILLQDVHLIEKLASFDRERIPERVVHARGTGVQGYFMSYGNYSSLTANPVFAHKGKKTDVFVRFSTVVHGQHSPEALRDPRGFTTRMYTEKGNWDLVFNNLPIFFIRDTIKFPDFIHSVKPDPITNRQDPNRLFDFLSKTPESTHMVTRLYSDEGTPKSYRFMRGSSVHAYKFVNSKGEYKYVKMFWVSKQGIKNFTAAEAKVQIGMDFSHATKDMYDAIEAGDYPSWEFQIQVMHPAQLDDFDFNPLDATKEWPETVFPKKTIGLMTLDRVPPNFFQFTEQFAPCPANIVLGVDFSEDRMLQGRAFSYSDTQRYRLGVNHFQLPVNRPKPPVHTYQQAGFMDGRITPDHINYEPNSDPHGFKEDPKYEQVHIPLKAGTYVQQPISKTLNFEQVGVVYRSYSKVDRAHLISNLAGDLNQVKDVSIKIKMAAHFYKAHRDYGTLVAKAVGVSLEEVKSVAATLSG